MKKVSEDGKRTAYETELKYNQRCARAYNQICSDQENLIVPSIPYGKFEPCDLLDIENKTFIHVKKSSRQSSILSHFFKQGANSAQILKAFPEAQEAFVARVRELSGDGAAKKLEMALRQSMNDWRVEYHIIDAPRADGSFRIPFFSRITLKDEYRRLRGMGLEAGIKFIPTEPGNTSQS